MCALLIVEEMKEDYDNLGPDAAIQTTGNNGTGKNRPLQTTFVFYSLILIEIIINP